MRAPTVITPPAAEPVNLSEAKAHLRLEDSTDDAFVAAKISAARQWVETYCRRGIVTQTLEATTEAFPSEDWIELAGGHLASIASVSYLDQAGALQTWAASNYEADTLGAPGRMRLAYGAAWPSTRERWNAVRIRYVVGWAPEQVPEPIKSAVLLLVSQLYEHRTPEVTGTIVSPVQFAVAALLAPYRLLRF